MTIGKEAQKVYQKGKREMGMDDYLSVERTRLSVERTHLSYMRTVVSMVVAGLTLYKVVGGRVGLAVAGILFCSALYFYIRGRKVCKDTNYRLKYMEEDE